MDQDKLPKNRHNGIALAAKISTVDWLSAASRFISRFCLFPGAWFAFVAAKMSHNGLTRLQIPDSIDTMNGSKLANSADDEKQAAFHSS